MTSPTCGPSAYAILAQSYLRSKTRFKGKEHVED
jgi:hypothetical protein